MTVAEDGKSLVSGSFYFYNEEGQRFANSGSAVEGGENTIINLTRANDSLTREQRYDYCHQRLQRHHHGQRQQQPQMDLEHRNRRDYRC